jgi:hypothetical protein
MTTKSGSADLKAGDHDIKVDYFQGDRGCGIRLSWEGPGIAKEVLPAAALFHRKGPDLDR